MAIWWGKCGVIPPLSRNCEATLLLSQTAHLNTQSNSPLRGKEVNFYDIGDSRAFEISSWPQARNFHFVVVVKETEVMKSSSLSVSTETRLIEMVFPNQTNHYGTLFGGRALDLMDKCAFITASRFARQSMVTASSERVDFEAPVKNGHLVEVIGTVIKSGTSSVSVAVDLFAEDLLSGERQLCARGHFVLVAVDEQNKPVLLPAGLRGHAIIDGAERTAVPPQQR